MPTESVTRTVRLPLATSHRKTARLREAVDEWQDIAKTVADHHPSFPEYEWGRTKQNPSFYRIVKREHPERDIMANAALEAVHKVGAAFESWRERGKQGSRPAFGEGDYLRLSARECDIVATEDGWGLSAKLFAYEDPEWWRITAGEYQREFLERVTDGDGDLGAVELHIDGDEVFAHASVSWEVDQVPADDVERWVGVDLGERVLYAAAVVGADGVAAVEVEPGREFRHHREKLDRAREQAMTDKEADEIGETRHRYTEQVTHTASRAIVDLAAEHHPCGIRVEDLTGYRESAEDPIHDWPHHMMREQIAYKATEAGVPVEVVNAAGTSITCRKCGERAPAARDGVEFSCQRCGYEIHADVNAAINIANGGVA